MKSKKESISPLGSDFDESLDQDLRDPVLASHFINAAMEENNDDYLKVAIGRVAKVHGISNVAKFTGLGREAIYKMLTEHGNPGLRNIQQILSSLGLELVVRVKDVSKHEVIDSRIRDIIQVESERAVRKALANEVRKAATKYKSDYAPRAGARTTTKKQSTKKIANFG